MFLVNFLLPICYMIETPRKDLRFQVDLDMSPSSFVTILRFPPFVLPRFPLTTSDIRVSGVSVHTPESRLPTVQTPSTRKEVYQRKLGKRTYSERNRYQTILFSSSMVWRIENPTLQYTEVCVRHQYSSVFPSSITSGPFCQRRINSLLNTWRR